MNQLRSEPALEIMVDDRRAQVPAGISVAAALFNLGVTDLRKSVSGESRGVLCGMGVCFECRLTIDDRPHQRACLTQVADGMRIRTGNAR
jgi:sarcosine oxidase subunit alpha